MAVVILGVGTDVHAYGSTGEWVYATGVAGPCVPLNPRAAQNTECDGSAVLVGGLIGRVKFHARGWADLVTGDAGGTIVQRFTGRSDWDPERRGEFRMRGTFTVDGETGAGHAWLRIEGISGVFARATGEMEVRAYMPITGGPQIVDYEGFWSPRGES